MDASSLVTDVYGALLAAISEGRLGAGTPLSQNKLAARLGVSRTPVREALLRLEQEGLVRRTQDAGFTVSTITAEEVEETCDLLELLDTYVYVRAARALPDGELASLRGLAAELVELAERGDAAAWKDADLRYHRTVMDAARNRYVADQLQQTRRRIHRFWVDDAHRHHRLRTCSEDHVALAEAMARRDEEALVATIAGHIQRLRHNVLGRLESARPLLPGSDGLAAVTVG